MQLDYYNAHFWGISQASLHRPQSIKNAVACLITGTKCYEHITPVLACLHQHLVHQILAFEFIPNLQGTEFTLHVGTFPTYWPGMCSLDPHDP